MTDLNQTETKIQNLLKQRAEILSELNRWQSMIDYKSDRKI